MEFIKYAWMQAKGQIHLITHTIDMDKILANPSFPDSLKNKLRLITEIKTFAQDSLGFSPSKNYTSVYNQDGKPLMWVVTASPAFEIKPHEWDFPVLGKLSYKGFFIREKAEKEAEKLKRQGLDTDIGTVGGWSTLGLFRDPILSDMLKKKEGSLANLIIHELTHGNVYIHDSVNYNESLANFIGDKGSLKFLEYKYGQNSIEYLTYETSKKDAEIFAKYSLKFLKDLQLAYNSFHEGISIKEMYLKKYKLLYEYVSGIDKLTLHKKKIYKEIAKEALHSKNAYFVSFIQYDSQQDIFEMEYKTKFHSNLNKYMEYLKQKYPGNQFGF